MPTNDTSTSPLDRMGRDLGRTTLHAGRPADNNGVVRPAAVQTGQQIPVDLPAGDLIFAFSVNGVDSTFTVDHATADETDKFMADAINKSDYLSLEVDSTIPTWVFQQRQYGLSNPPSKADSVRAGQQIVAKLPPSVIQEVGNAEFRGDFVDSSVSLQAVDGITQNATLIPLAQWQPAIFLRFPLEQVVPTPSGIPAGMQVYGIGGTPEGDRWFLDQLGLLPGPAAPQPVTINGISFALEAIDGSGTATQTPVAEWSIARCNLSQESRPGKQQILDFKNTAVMPLTFPYIVLSGDPGQEQDAIRLLQMASITNSGGYYFGATTGVQNAQSLILSVLLAPKPDPAHAESGLLPLAANALALGAGNAPDTIRFNGAEQIQIKPGSPIGTVAFGWTRKVPAAPATKEDKFGYGTISIVDYVAKDGANNPIPCPTPVISPMEAQSGESFLRQAAGATAAIRLASPRATSTLTDADDTGTHYYRGSLTCYDKKGKQSPWIRLRDDKQRQITVVPGFRDIFGNHFDAVQGPAITQRMFYTDAIVAPPDWPGMRFAVYPEVKNGQPALTAELLFDSGLTLTDDRKRKMGEISTQLRGVDGDVCVYLIAEPLVAGLNDLKAMDIANQIDKWAGGDTSSFVRALGTFACGGAIADLTVFNPQVQITRTNGNYLPSPSDLPQTDWLAALILGQVTSATVPIAIQTDAAPAVLPPPGPDERHDEYGAVATKLQKVIATGGNLQVGIQRDHFNQHDIWLIPSALFPSEDTSAVWAFATPCPLRNQPGNESYQADPQKIDAGVPDFTGTATSVQKWQKYNLPLVSQAAVDQDFDDLGRTAFRAIEDDTADLGQLMPRTNATTMRSLLATREGVARQLAIFNTSKNGTSSGFIVPMLADSAETDFDGAAINRIASDCLLGDLNSFYAVSTIVQMPLARPGNKDKIQTFRGMIDTRLDTSKPPDPSIGAFSDVLLGGGDPRVTFLYDLAPGVPTPPPLPVMRVNITHIQLPLPGAASGASPFNQGPWIQLVPTDSPPYTLHWTPPQDPIPVAIRALPAKPILESASTTLPSLGAGSPITVDASSARLLAQWGWTFSFSLVNSAKNADKVHVTIKYPNPQQQVKVSASIYAATDWEPKSLLQVLFVLKQLKDNWASPAIQGKQLAVLADLTEYLLQFLSSGPPHNPPVPDLSSRSRDPVDVFVIDALVPAHHGDSLVVMNDIDVGWEPESTKPTRIDTATVVAPGESTNNNACLTSSNPKRSYELSLVLTRNEEFQVGGKEQGANDLLIYQCPPVQWPGGCSAQNLWGPEPLLFDKKGSTLDVALGAFFDGLLHGADLTHLTLEASASMFWTKGAMTATTPFVLLPVDQAFQTVQAPTAGDIASFVYGKCVALLGANTPAPAELDSSRIRLRVKITAPENDVPRGAAVVLEIQSIDFPL